MENTPEMIAVKEELLRKLLQEIDQALLLSQQELLKSGELYELEDRAYVLLGEIGDVFGDILRRKIEKATPQWKAVPRAGSYATHNEAREKLTPLRALIEELFEAGVGIKPINIPSIDTSQNPSMREAIKDAQLLVDKSGAPNAVDRFHTLLQAYLQEQCTKANIPYDPEASINILLKLLKENHPVLLELQAKEPEVVEILKGMSNTLNKLFTL